MKTLKTVWVFVATEPNGDEGIPAVLHGDIMMPLVAGDQARVDSLKLHAATIAASRGIEIELRKYTTYETVEVITA